MGKNWFPTKQQELLPFAQNIATLITATPADYGVLASDATALTTATSEYGSALSAALAPETSTEVTVATKDIKKAALIAELRRLYKKFDAALLAADRRLELGLPPIDSEPTPIPPPQTAPALSFISVFGYTARVRASDPLNPTRRAKPDGVAGLAVFSFIGAQPPAEIDAWTFEGDTSRTTLDVIFDPAQVPAGSQVWIRGCWFNPRFARGPLSVAITTTLAGEVGASAA